LPATLAASGVLLVLASGIAFFLDGLTSALGAAAGVVLVSGSYVVSHLCVALADAVNRTLVMPVGLLVYGVKILVLGLVMAGVAAAGWPGLPAMGVGIMAAVVVWTAAQAVWVWRARIPYVEIDPI
jgi:ATP synthase protein I